MLPLSRQVVVWGRTDRSNYVIYIFGQVGGKLQKLREVKETCQHNGVSLLGVVVKGEELLAVVCNECMDIKLVDLLKVNLFKAFQFGEKTPWKMCAGDAGRLWVCMHVGEVIELNCSSEKFTPTGRKLQVELKCAVFVCFLPAPHNALVFTGYGPFFCVSCTSGEKLWEVEGRVNGDPSGLMFSSEYQALLIADRKSKSMQVLDPSSGSHLQTLPLPAELGTLFRCCLSNNTIFTISDAHGETGLSCFSLRPTRVSSP